VPYTIVAPVYFMENLLQPWILPSLRQGKLAMALPARRSLQQIAVADIGAFVAAVIERGDTVFGRRFDIAGDELTGEEPFSAAITPLEMTGPLFTCTRKGFEASLATISKLSGPICSRAPR